MQASNCVVCGTPLLAPPATPVQTCSPECAARLAPVPRGHRRCVCGRLFVPRSGAHRFCSKQCRRASRRGVVKVCERCKEPFAARDDQQRFCSRRCANSRKRAVTAGRKSVRPAPPILARLLEFHSQAEIAYIYGVTQPAVHYWVRHDLEIGDPNGLSGNGPSP